MSNVDMFVEKAVMEGADGSVVNNIIRATPLVATMPSKETNKGRENVYEVVTSIDSIPQNEIDSPLTEVNAESKLERTGLGHWSAKQTVGVGKISELGVPIGTYFADKASKVFAKTAQNFESSIIYNSIQSTAIANHKKTGTIFTGNRVHSLGGATANKQFSIQIVTWDGDNTTGLYSTQAFGGVGSVRTGMFEVIPISGGTAYEDPTTKIQVYGTTYRMDAGVQLANAQHVTSIVNINNSASIVADIKTANLDYHLSMMLENSAPEDGQTYIYMRPELLTAISSAFKDSVNSTDFAIGDYSRKILTWQGIPIISTRNMLNGTESVVTGI